MEGTATVERLQGVQPADGPALLRHPQDEHNKVHRLDALDAYNQKLVKKIAVRGITVKGLAGTNAYLYLESIDDLHDQAAGGAGRAGDSAEPAASSA